MLAKQLLSDEATARSAPNLLRTSHDAYAIVSATLHTVIPANSIEPGNQLAASFEYLEALVAAQTAYSCEPGRAVMRPIEQRIFNGNKTRSSFILCIIKEFDDQDNEFPTSTTDGGGYLSEEAKW